jgi:GNAT superfamily N-acetyltransferase
MLRGRGRHTTAPPPEPKGSPKVDHPALAMRRFTVADVAVADHLLQAAFRASASFQVDLQRYLVIQPDGWRLATWAGAPAGLVGAIDYGLFAYIGLMAVHPALQSRGIGRALMQHLLAWLDARGTLMALLDATEAGQPLYTAHGFREQDDACVFEEQTQPHAPRRVDRVPLLEPKDLAAVVAFDAPIFGAERGVVIRAYLADFPGRCFVVHDEAGQLSGYLCAQSRRLGPWAARRPEDAEALLQAALSLSYAGAPQVIVPRMNRAAGPLLERDGFRLVWATRHMRRGGAGLPGQRERLYGQASFAIG